MKTRVSSLITFAAVLGGFLVGPLWAAPQKKPAMAFPVESATRDGDRIVKVGVPESAVIRWIGTPNRKLSDDVWLYNRFEGSREEANEAGCDTLLVSIANGKVADIKLINPRARNIIIAKAKSNSTKSVLKSVGE